MWGAWDLEERRQMRNTLLLGTAKRSVIPALVSMVVAMVLSITGCGGGGGETTVIREQPAETQPAKTTTVTQQVGGGGGGGAPAVPAEAQPTGDAPDVVGQRLDIAKDDLRAAGYRARVSGGGILGVVVDRNWVVCDQQPPEGDTVDINVDRSC
jgi:hypothetical protein